MKKKSNMVWRYFKEFFTNSLAPFVMYLVASGVVLIVLAKDKESLMLTWGIIAGVVATAYDGLLTFHCGGSHYEMLVSGNMKRRSAYELGTELNITSYKLEKEYRPWKGFVIGLFVALPVIIGGLVLGINQSQIGPEIETPKGLSYVLIILDFIAGWAILPFQMKLRNGSMVSPYLSLLLALIPIVVSGACYIWGAYAKRNKTLRKQEAEARRLEEEMNKPKKINYGGLPGTKPNKKK